jgi:hypothetical protein
MREAMASEATLWAAVILQAIEDASMKVAVVKPDATQSRRWELAAKARAKEEARRWLTCPNRDFEAVCTLAGMNAEAVREWARQEIPPE